MKRRNALFLLITATTFCSSARAGVVGPTAVALSGTTSPAGSNYTSFGTPVLNDAGQVAFYATLSASSATGIFAGNPGSLQTVALRNGAAPGGGTYTTLTSPFAMNSLGQVAFYATANGVENIFAGAPGSVQLVARAGAAAPGGGTYSSLAGISRNPVLNDAGQVAFYAGLTIGSSGSAGVFAGLPGAVQCIAKIGTPASIGGTFYSFKSPVLNGANQVAVIADVTNGGSNFRGVFLGSPGALEPIALTGMASPAGGTYDSIAAFPGVNSSGEVVFLSFLNDSSSRQGIFAGGLGSVQTVALRDTPAPSGGNYDAFFTPLINSSGVVTFRSLVKDETNSIGLFEGAPGAVQTVALSGDSAPGGAFFSDFTIHNAINGSGLLAFAANLTGPGVDTTNDLGLYAGMPGSLVKIVREGDTIDVDPSAGVDNRTVKGFGSIDAADGAGGQDGHGPYSNDAGLLVYQLSFTDDSSGIFTSSIAIVPQLGDFNHDGTVNAADYVVWRHSNGPSTDYDLWRAHFGETLPGSGASNGNRLVPEPPSLFIIAMIAAWHFGASATHKRKPPAD